MNQVKVTRISEVGFCELGEGPHWDIQGKCLYYVDIPGKAIHRYCPETNTHTKAILDGNSVSLIVPVHGQTGKFLVGVDNKIVLVTWDGKSEKISSAEIVTKVDEHLSESRVNDGKCDAAGRLWFGTMAAVPDKNKKYALFSLENKRATQRVEGVMVSNGLAWNAENTKFYYIDTMTKSVDEFDYDLSTGNLSNRRVVFSFEKAGFPFLPDGMTIDTDDNLWVACFNGSCVLNIDPRQPNKLIRKVDLPVKQITSVGFGGCNLDELYVTSAKVKFGDEILHGPENGGIYRITGLGVKGFAPNCARL